MRITLSALLLASLVAIAAAPAGAQPEFYYVVQYSRHVASEVYLIDRYGAILMVAARLPLTHIPVSLVQDEANSGFYILGNSLGTPHHGFVHHVDANGIHTTINASAPWSAFPAHMLRDGDGRWLVLDNDVLTPGIMVYDFRGRSLTSISFAPNLSAWAAAIHPPSGQILIRGSTKTPPLEFGYFFVDPNTGAWTRVATSSTLVYTGVGSREPVYDASFDGFWDNPLDFNSRSGMVLRVNRQFGLTTFARHPGLVPVSLEPGSGRGFARPFRALMTPTLMTPPAPFTLFAMDRAGALTTLGTLPGSGNLWPRSDLLRHESRHLTWFMNRAPHDRTLALSFPREPGRPYVAGLSMHGASPGVPLPDGRTLPLNPDPITALSVQGGIPGILSGTVGVLDRYGCASVRVDVGPFAKALRGMRFVAAAVILDPQASSGIAIVSDATGFTVR